MCVNSPRALRNILRLSVYHAYSILCVKQQNLANLCRHYDMKKGYFAVNARHRNSVLCNTKKKKHKYVINILLLAISDSELISRTVLS